VAGAEPTMASRDAARVQAFELAYEAQTGDSAAPGRIAALARHADGAGWDDVVRACLFGQAVLARIAGDPAAAGIVARLIDASSAARDQVMLALGLGLRSNEAFSGRDPNGAMSRDADLARAVVLLERAGGASIELIAAHKVCGVAFSTRSLFELGDAQYRAALNAGELHSRGSFDAVLAPIACNLAETQVCWAAMLRQLGDADAVTERWRAWVEASLLTSSFSIPPDIRRELAALELLLEAIAGRDTSERVRALLDAHRGGESYNARCRSLLALSAALSSAGNAASGAAATEQAIAMLDPSLQTHLYDLALFVAAEIEARSGSSSGLRCARRQLEQRWGTRLSSLGAMQSLIQAERVAGEVERLSRHARLDDLTGIGNRRALGQFLSELDLRDVRSIGLILLDLDDFKAVNDRHGHLAGDAVLVAVAHELERHIRPGDLAARLGGDEFVVVLGDVDLDTSLARATELLSQLGRRSFREVGAGTRVSLSAGVSAGPPASVLELWAEADAALYRAKAGGGRRVRRSRVAGPAGDHAAAG
jgi:diguanylate cyclase (GGDEF)-like protein